ncbi:MAG: hypothetical protein ACETVN_01420, partial [Asgard group archaeon]
WYPIWDIFVIHAKTFNDLLGRIVENIAKVEDVRNRQILLVLEDIHLDPWRANLILQYAWRKKNLKLLLTARPKYRETLMASLPIGGGGLENYFERCEKIQLESEDIPEKIIKRYEEKKEEELKQEWNVKKQDLPLLKKKGEASLWLLAYYLEAYDPETGLDEESIYKKVERYLDSIDERYGIEKMGEGKDVLLFLAPLYLHEIPTQEEFLTLELEPGYDPNTLYCLTSVGEIRQIKTIEATYYILHHSEIANIYLETAQRIPRLISSIKSRLKKVNQSLGQKDQDFKTDILNLYIQKNPKNTLTVIRQLSPEDLKRIFGNTQTQNKIIQSIKKAINLAEDIWDVAFCFLGFFRAMSRVGAEVARAIDIDALAKKINREEEVLLNVMLCLSAVAQVSAVVQVSSDSWNKLTKALNMETLAKKIHKEDDLRIVGLCFFVFAIVSPEDKERLVDALKTKTIAEKINKTEDLWAVGWCFSNFVRVSPEMAEKLAYEIDLETLSQKINASNTPEGVEYCCSGVLKASIYRAEELCDMITVDEYHELFRKMLDEKRQGKR